MANELTITTKLTVSKDGQTVTLDSTKTLNLDGSGKLAAVQKIGTADEQVDFPADLVSEGVSFIGFKNIDATNFVEFSMGTGADANTGFDARRFAKLYPGEVAVLRTHKAAGSNPAIYAKANNADCNIQVVAVGDLNIP
jgi:hypothetical protein